MKKITILGEEVNIAFNMASIISFEIISGKSYNDIDLTSTKDTLELNAAVIVANNPKSGITVNKLMFEAKSEDIAKLNKAVADELMEWSHIPETLEGEDKQEGDEEEKNS